VAAVREHIAAGLTYQCNLTDRLRTRDVGDPTALYARLALAQQGAYSAYLDLGRHVVVSASPELFFEWRGDRLRTRPMKGTAARGRNAGEDRARARGLRLSAKEQAENLMIVDLLRNDLSQVAQVGSVTVRDLFTLERYPTVWQLTSEITARARDDVGLTDVFRALFPCGSVTGAPKQRTMRLIRELEPGARGVYCGAIGLIAPPGVPSAPGSASRSARPSSTGRPATRCTASAAGSPGAPIRPLSAPSSRPRPRSLPGVTETSVPGRWQRPSRPGQRRPEGPNGSQPGLGPRSTSLHPIAERASATHVKARRLASLLPPTERAIPILLGERRRCRVAYPAAPGSAAAYYPETNVLVPLDSVADISQTPTSKGIVVRLEPARHETTSYSE
jgi:hypothetical protein